MTKTIPKLLKSSLQRVLFRNVIGGPFQGMKYVRAAHCSALPPKILGTYEKEIWPFLAECLKWDKGVFVDVGAAEGYYAVGLLRLNPGLRCITFEAEEPARREMQQLAAANNVASRIKSHGFGNHADLQAALTTGDKTLLLVDIEGGELALLDPTKVPALLNTTMVVEIHDWAFRPTDALKVFKERFEKTHEIIEVKARNPLASDIPHPIWRGFASTSRGIARRLVYERPLNMRWFCCKPIPKKNGS